MILNLSNLTSVCCDQITFRLEILMANEKLKQDSINLPMFRSVESVRINRKFKFSTDKNKKKQHNGKENKQTCKKLKQVIIKKVPRCYTHTGYDFINLKEIEQLIVPVLISTGHFKDGDVIKLELMKINNRRNKIPQYKIKHRYVNMKAST